MDPKRATVRLTENFEANLDAIEAFWDENDSPQSYDRLLDELSDIVIPNLGRFPALGRPFATRQSDSAEAVAKQEKLQAQLARLGDESDIREYVTAEYLILYAVVNRMAVYLLSIRHHKQLSFDFVHLWQDRDERP